MDKILHHMRKQSIIYRKVLIAVVEAGGSHKADK